MFKSMPFILVAVIILTCFFGSMLSLPMMQLLYTASMLIKAAIVWLLPWVIFSLLFKAAVNLAQHATKIISIILLLVVSSNFLTTFLSRFVGSYVYGLNLAIVPPTSASSLQPLWTLHLPTLLANNHAMFAGIVLGVTSARWLPTTASSIANFLEMMTGRILKTIVWVIPLFVAGFLMKLQHDDMIHIIFKDYIKILSIIATTQLTYISLVYWLLDSGKMKRFIGSIKNMLPAVITGFSTMSSAASMPLTIIGVEKNTQNHDLARSVVPATVNIHLIGDCFAIPIFAFAILKSYGVAEPTLLQFLYFACYFVLAKFSVAAIPGGGIIVMLPILENHLGFKADMMSLITALYILFDPVITSANILGNGGFAKLMDKIATTWPELKSQSSVDN